MWLVGTNTRNPFPRSFRTKKAASEFGRKTYPGQTFFVWKQKPQSVVQYL